MRIKILIFAILFTVISSNFAPITAKADEVYEWTNFAEWCEYNDVDIDTLPIQYDENKIYAFVKLSNWGSKYQDVLFVWDESVEPGWTYGGYFKTSRTKCEAIYVMRYTEVYGDNAEYPGWNNLIDDTGPIYTTIDEVYYSDVCLPWESAIYGEGCYFHATHTGQYMQWQEAITYLTLLSGHPLNT